MLFRKSIATINLQAIRFNIKEHLKIIPKNTEYMAVIKANAYGHGAIQVANVALEAGATWLGIVTIQEGIQIRTHFPFAKVFLLGLWNFKDLQAIKDYNLICQISYLEQLDYIYKFYEISKVVLEMHLMIETGMGRIGLMIEELDQIFNKYDDKKINITGICTHLSSAQQDLQYSQFQIANFQKAIKKTQQHLQLKYVHMCSSPGIKFANPCYNIYRIGISMYGVQTKFHQQSHVKLRKALTLSTQIAALKLFPPKWGISYAHQFVTEKQTLIATLPIGYADGIFRDLGNKGYVLIRGKRAPIVGRICMDYMMVDVTEIEGVELQDKVVIIGKDGKEEITVEEVAQLCDTIPHEIFCSLSSRLIRQYFNDYIKQ